MYLPTDCTVVTQLKRVLFKREGAVAGFKLWFNDSVKEYRTISAKAVFSVQDIPTEFGQLLTH